MANARIFYPLHAIGFAQDGLALPATGIYNTGYRAAKGVQSYTSNTDFALEQVYQLGQLSLYENIEELPDINISISKVADGYSLLQHLATPDATASNLAGRFANKCMGAIAYYDISRDSASGIPLSTVQLSGLYVSSLSWSIPVQGNVVETVGLVCRDKTWNFTPTGQPFGLSTTFTGSETSLNPTLPSGGVQRRQDVDMSLSRWPTEVQGISTGGTSPTGINPTGANGQFQAHIQNVNISISLGREDLFELGRKGSYYRFAQFPTEVTTTIEITSTERAEGFSVSSSTDNLSNQYIYIVLAHGITIDLGTKNKLKSIAQSGGDTSGGNVSVTYTYSNFNDYICRYTAKDPAGL